MGRVHLKLIFASLLALSVLLVSFTAQALRYVPRADETLSHISLIHYGSPKKLIYITHTNNIDDPKRMPRGVRLRIPTVWRYRLRKGDDLAKVARKHLKDASRADFLAWLNNIKDPRKLKSGHLITIPFLIRHRVTKGQNMLKVARMYFWSTRPTGLLRKFNDKRNNVLKVGEIIYVPIYDSEAATEKVKERLKRHLGKQKKAEDEAKRRAMAAAEKARTKPDAGQSTDKPEPQSETEAEIAMILGYKTSEQSVPDAGQGDSEALAGNPQATRLIAKASELYREGEYEQARANLSRALDLTGLTKADEAEAREVLAFGLVALERPKEAEHEFVRLMMVVPDRKLDPETTSPKILKVFEKAKGK